MMSMVNLIDQICVSPGMYLGTRTITGLYHFLEGVGFASRQFDPEWSDPVYDGFQGWIEKELNINLTRDWAHIILFHSSDEIHAFETFQVLFRRYLDETSR